MAQAKPILEGKFWIVEDKGVKVGTLTLDENKYILSDRQGTHFFDSEKQLQKSLGKIKWDHKEITESITYEVHGFPTSYQPFNPMYDVKRKLPLFSKSAKSKSLYCAGYYIIRFNVNWLKSFCPKLITIKNNDYRGPFKTEMEAKQELSNANAK